jgi:hypothetical protein
MPKPAAARITLAFQEGTRDKVYHAEIVPKGKGHVVNVSFGRRGAKLSTATKTPAPIPLDRARALFEKLVQEKLAKGYKRVTAKTNLAAQSATPAESFLVRTGYAKPVQYGAHRAKVRLARKGGGWVLGIEVISGKHGDDDNQVQLHLMDFPLKPDADPRSQPVRLRIPHGDDDESDRPLTNFYNYEHTATENNRIEVTPLPGGDDRFHLKWSGAGTELADRFDVNCTATLARTIGYPY